MHGLRLNDSSHWEETSPFARGAKERPLRLLVDERTSRSVGYELLRGFGRHKDLVVASTGDGFHRKLLFGSVGEGGWPSSLSLVDREGNLQRTLTFPPNWPSLASRPSESSRRAAFLLGAARSLRVDMLVCDDLILLPGFFRRFVDEANPMSPRTALGFVGLFLRSREDFTVDMSPGFSHSVNRGSFYWTLTRALLPEGWRWFGACVDAGLLRGRDVVSVAQTALRRVDQALRARDRFLIQLQLPQNNDTADELLFYLDMMMLALNGALDVTGRIANEVYGIDARPTEVSFRREGWLRKLKRVAPAIADLVEGDEHGTTIEIMARLRNTIHGESLQTARHWGPSVPTSTDLLLPVDDPMETASLLEKMACLDEWGYQRHIKGFVTLNPARCVHIVFPRVVRLLNAVMRETDVDRILSDATRKQSLGPPADDDSEFGYATGLKLGLLAGFSDVIAAERARWASSA